MTYANLLSIYKDNINTYCCVNIFHVSGRTKIFFNNNFFLAAITDYLDGYLARKMNEVSKLGKFLDPVADKLLVITTLLLLLVDNNSLIIFIPICIIILREMIISSLREWVVLENSKKPLNVNIYGKLKTMFQMFSIGFLLFNGTIFTIDTYVIGLYGIYIAAFLSLVSMIIYFKNVIRS